MGHVEILSEPKAIGMADDWYQFATEDHFWIQWRHRQVIKAVRSSGLTLTNGLEIGCGNAVPRGLLERDLDIPIDACDLNQAGLSQAKQGRGRLLFYDIFDQDPSLIHAYDVIFLLDVLEHIPDDRAFLAAAANHLRPGGLIVVNVPASMLLFSQYDTVTGHVRRYSKPVLSNVFQTAGITIEGISYWGMLMVPVLLARKIWLHRVAAADTMRVGFSPPNQLALGLLSGLKDLETLIPFPVPCGSSLIAWGRASPQQNG